MHSIEDFILSIYALRSLFICALPEDEQVCVLCTSYEILSVLRLTKPSTIVERDIRRYIVGNVTYFLTHNLM